MFKCGICKNSSKSGEPVTKVVTYRRDVTYMTNSVKPTEIGKGWEIKKEEMLCQDCCKRMKIPSAIPKPKRDNTLHNPPNAIPAHSTLLRKHSPRGSMIRAGG